MYSYICNIVVHTRAHTHTHRYIHIYIYTHTHTYANYICNIQKKKRRNISESRELTLPSGSLAMTVLLRSTPPFLSSVQHTYIHHVYEYATVYYYMYNA